MKNTLELIDLSVNKKKGETITTKVGLVNVPTRREEDEITIEATLIVNECVMSDKNVEKLKDKLYQLLGELEV